MREKGTWDGKKICAQGMFQGGRENLGGKLASMCRIVRGAVMERENFKMLAML